MDSCDSSETNLVIVTRRDRYIQLCRKYWRLLVILVTPVVLIPVVYISEKPAYKCFYIFLITATCLITDVIHPCVASLIIPLAFSSIIAAFGHDCLITELFIKYELLDCAGVMMLIAAIEQSNIHRRVALKLLLVFGCSHYRLSFLLFFTSMIISMWISNVLACGIMMPLVKSILMELEKMGILEVYHPIRNSYRTNSYQGKSTPSPTDYTVFYFLGIAYSSSIGSMATIFGSQANQIFKIYCEMIFPISPKIEFPHFLLINLPGVLVMEAMLYTWMNIYFLGLFRAQSEIALEIGLTEEEAQYINTLLVIQYRQLGKIKFREAVVGTVVILAAVLQPTITMLQPKNYDWSVQNHLNMSSPCFICVILLFIIPREISYLKCFKTSRGSGSDGNIIEKPLEKACLCWYSVIKDINWSVLFIIGGSNALFQSLKDSNMTDEFERFLHLFKNWPSSVIVLVIIIFCKILAEFASSSTVVYCMLPSIARFSCACHVNPHYFMLGCALASSQPFQLVTGAPINALVCEYVYIPPRKMMYAGFGPSVMGSVVTWFTVSVWSAAIWPDINFYPEWAGGVCIALSANGDTGTSNDAGGGPACQGRRRSAHSPLAAERIEFARNSDLRYHGRLKLDSRRAGGRRRYVGGYYSDKIPPCDKGDGIPEFYGS